MTAPDLPPLVALRPCGCLAAVCHDPTPAVRAHFRHRHLNRRLDVGQWTDGPLPAESCLRCQHEE